VRGFHIRGQHNLRKKSWIALLPKGLWGLDRQQKIKESPTEFPCRRMSVRRGRSLLSKIPLANPGSEVSVMPFR
jgi:hypothetical protein